MRFLDDMPYPYGAWHVEDLMAHAQSNLDWPPRPPPADDVGWGEPIPLPRRENSPPRRRMRVE
jgi:hypothetical protein